ncbi:hypothetical protein BKA69DRAFT_479421 [Paraphysoderma sedebokerense]|nr:hypothetical protein BKA69DRAFT_479421 [Paraphysoderma sedebokerense]
MLPATISAQSQKRISQAGFTLYFVPETPSPYSEPCNTKEHRYRYGLHSYNTRNSTYFGKIHAWSLIHYTKLVYLEVTTFLFENIDPIFDFPSFSAPHSYIPQYFTSHLMVFEPNITIYRRMIDQFFSTSSHDCTETGFLNSIFPDWFHSSNRIPLH